jgi:hypothetical protein
VSNQKDCIEDSIEERRLQTDRYSDSSCLGPYHLWDISAYYGPTEIRLSSTDLCLTVSSNTSTLTDRNLTVSPCSGSPSQQWMTAGFLGTVFSHAGLCLTSTKGRTLPDSFASANARLAPCGAENQRWVARRRSYVTMDVGGSKMEE